MGIILSPLFYTKIGGINLVFVESLWGDEFTLTNDYDKIKQIIKKVNSPKSIESMSPEKVLKSKTIPFEEKLRVTENEVNRTLSKYSENITCIYTREEFTKYIDKVLENGIVAIDTETLGTRTDIEKPGTDPFTCRIAGLCLYTPDMKAAYIPVNHVNYKNGERWENQVTEQDIKEELTRIVDNEIFTVFHNGKFDHMVLHYTCGVDVPIYWDSMIAAQCLNENERAGLKFQYRDKIDPDQEKYDLDKLFDIEQADKYPIELFSLYAATDSYMTYKLYEYQRKEFKKPGNERLYNLFKDIEMPVVGVTTDMEMRGIAVDKAFAERLSKKFHKKLNELNIVIDKEMSKYSDLIKEWRESPEANYCKTINKRKQKSLNEKLSDPIELTSATQLSIFLYDILHILKPNKEGKKSTDEAALLSIENKLPLAGLILKKREYEKLLGTYIDVLPTYCSPYDDRVHASFHQLGREENNVVTGRMSSSEPSMQVIPARGDVVSIRCMFTGTTEYHEYDQEDNYYDVPIEEEVLLLDGTYKWVSELTEGDILCTEDHVHRIEQKDRSIRVYVK